MSTKTVDVPAGDLSWITRVMRACDALPSLGGPNSRQRYCNQVANCFYDSIDEFSKANLAARQTVVALWPAMVNLISEFFPDAADVAYDHLGYAAIFALTSSGIIGSSKRDSASHLTAPDYETAKAWCNGTVDVPVVQRQSRSKIGTARLPYSVSIAILLFCIAIYVAFLVLFLRTLKEAILTWQCSPYWYGSLWYFGNCAPAIIQAINRVFTSDFTLFQQNEAGATPFRASEDTSKLSIWFQIFKLQIKGEPFRLLIRSQPDSFFKGLVDTIVTGVRLGLFIFGSIIHSSLILMPLPWDVLLFGLIVAAGFFPRVFWVNFCVAGVHPQTMVVRY